MAQCRGGTIEQGNIETITSKSVKGHRIGKHWQHWSNVELAELVEVSETSEQYGSGGTGGNIRNVRARWSRNMVYDSLKLSR